jgi:hypothetical protein
MLFAHYSIARSRPVPTPDRLPPWIQQLDEEDIAFLQRFLLASGSLKAVAAQYGVSYPTLRARLDRLIAKVQALGDERERDPFRRRIRAMAAEGRLDMETAREILREYDTRKK